MLIYVIDDERIILNESGETIRAAAPDAEVEAFSHSTAALQVITERGERPDIIFTDIEMPGLGGLEFAAQVKRISPQTRLVFVTGYPQYALEAFRLHAQGYILKPLNAERVREELDLLQTPVPERTPRADVLSVTCFGRFEVFWQGEPLKFERRQTKELFAFLIDQEGASCTAEEIAASLWEDESNIRSAKARLRKLVQDLRKTLGAIGMDEAVIRHSGLLAIRRNKVECDYYRMLSGDMEALNAYRGEYMSQYSWAELTRAKLYFRAGGPD